MISKRALALLAMDGDAPGAAKRSRDADIGSKEVTAVDELNKGQQVLDQVGNDREKERKRHKGDHSKRGHGPSKHGTSKDMLVLGLPTGVVPPGGTPPPSAPSTGTAGPILIEIGPQARWNLGDLQPLEAFGAFHLPQDSASYANFSRDDVIRRSHRRLGMFIADYERLINELDAELKQQIRSERDEEVKKLEKGLSELTLDRNQASGKMKELEGEVKNLKETAKKDREDLEKKVKENVAEMGRLRKLVDELSKEKTRLLSEDKILRREVESLKESLAESDMELLESLAAGYNACYNRLKDKGVDLVGHDFVSYRAEVRAEVAKQGNEPPANKVMSSV